MKNKKESFRMYFNRTELKKVINWHLNGRAKVQKINTFGSESVIMHIHSIKNEYGHYWVNDISGFGYIQSTVYIPEKNILKTVYVLDLKDLPRIISEVTFFQSDEKSRLKMNYPIVKLLSQ